MRRLHRFSIIFPPKNAQEEFYDKKKIQRRLLRYQIYLDCWIDVHSSFTRCGLCLLICVMLLPTHLSHVGFGNYTFIGMDIKSIVKMFFIFFFYFLFFFYETVPYSGIVIR